MQPHRSSSAFCILPILFLCLFAWAFGLENLAQSASTSPGPVLVNLKGTGQAKYGLDLSNGAHDEIELNWEVNLQFTPQNLLKSGNLVVSYQAGFTGSYRIWGTADRLSQNGQFLNSVSFDDRDQGVSAPISFPVETTFSLEGNLTSLRLDLPASSSTPYIYRLDFVPGVNKSTIWTRLRSPFVYPADIESNPLTLTAETLNSATSFTGRVLDETTRQPISGAVVQIGTVQRTTDAGGGFSVDRVPPGSLTVRITKAGYQTYGHTATMPAFFPVTMDFTLTSGSVAGHVYCTCDGSPVANALVQIGNYSGTSDSGGGYSIGGVPPGTYSVTVSAAGYSTVTSSTTISSGEPSTASDFTLSPNTPDIARILTVVNGRVQISTPNGNSIQAAFTPGGGLSLSQAACLLGVKHFNFYQQVLTDPSYIIFAPKLPYTDPPHALHSGSLNCIPIKGAPCEIADDHPFYYNEGAAYPGFANVQSHISPDGKTLTFYDAPSDPVYNNPTFWALPLTFKTQLVGVTGDSSFVVFYTFYWKSYFSGSIGQTVAYHASLLVYTNGVGSNEVFRTNVQASGISPEETALMIQDGGGFPITIQPVSQTVHSGANVSFSLAPTNSSSSLSYQWRKNGTNIVGATNMALQLVNVTTNNTGNYDVIVSNTNGNMGSGGATLTVDADAGLTHQPVLRLIPATGANYILSLSGEVGQNYGIQSSTDLLQWSDWTNVLGPDWSMAFTIPSKTNVNARFYRAAKTP